ncbi:MAG: kinetochore Spc25 family protein [Myxococcota bacterium]|nr:kinetochore Spc25 family protein [Myxococcota bacterium]
MDRRTIELRIGGQKYRVVSSATEEELNRIAELVRAKLNESGGRPRNDPGKAMLLAALALAHDVMVERERRESLEKRTHELLSRTLSRIDDALGAEPPLTDPSPE